MYLVLWALGFSASIRSLIPKFEKHQRDDNLSRDYAPGTTDYLEVMRVNKN